MNLLLVIYILGWVIIFEGGFLLVPTLTGLIYHEQEWIFFFLTALASAALGFLITRFRPKSGRFFAREGYVICAATWIVISLIGAVPLAMMSAFPSYLDALFEIVSGFTINLDVYGIRYGNTYNINRIVSFATTDIQFI